MKRTIHEATRIIALTAALTAGIGEAACATAVASPRPVTMVELAHQIEAEPTVPGKTPNGAYFNRNLPHHEHATMSVASTELAKGRPNPNDPDAIEISISPQTSNTASYKPSFLDITFIKERVGDSWSALEDMDVPSEPDDEMYHVDVSDQKFVNTYFTNVVGGKLVTTPEGLTSSTQAATVALHGMQQEAEGMLLNIIHDRDIEK